MTLKDNNYDEKYTMGTFQFKKNDPLFEALTMEQLKNDQVSNIFIHGKRDFVKRLCHGCQCHGIHSFECSSMYLIFSLILVHFKLFKTKF
jgi:hypothetical protein